MNFDFEISKVDFNMGELLFFTILLYELHPKTCFFMLPRPLLLKVIFIFQSARKFELCKTLIFLLTTMPRHLVSVQNLMP